MSEKWAGYYVMKCSFLRLRSIIHNIIRNILKMLETLIIVLLVLWLLGFSFHVGGSLIHTLLVIALIVFIVRMIF